MNTALAKWFIALVAPCLCLTPRAGARGWEQLTPLPAPNGGFIALALPDAIFVVGGTNWEGGEKHWLRTVHRLELATLRWTTLAPLAEPVAYGVGATSGSEGVVVGGSTGRAMFHGRVRVTATRVTQDPAHGVSVPAVVAAGARVGDEIVFLGGADDAANVPGLRRETSAWNLRTGALRALPEFPGPPLGSAVAVSVADELFVFAGCTWDPQAKSIVNLSSAFALRPRTQQWRRLAPLPFPVRGLGAVVLDERHVYVAGGYRGGATDFVDTAFIYDLEKDSYTPATPLPYRASAGLVRAGGYVYCLGGEDQQRHRAAYCYRIKVEDLNPLGLGSPKP